MVSDSAPRPLQTETGAAENRPSDRRAFFLRIFPSIMLPMFIAVVDQTIVATALPAISASLGEADHVSWIVVSYLIANTIAAPVYGRLGDAFGRRRMIFVALGVMIFASVGCAMSANLRVLVAFRVLQGLGGGGLMTLSQALIGETIAPRDRARYQGYLAAVVVFSNSFGPIVGGMLTESFGWRSIFWMNVPLGVLAFAMGFRLPANVPNGEVWRFDYGGLVFFVLFVAPALLVFEEIREFSVSNTPQILATSALAALSVYCLIRHEDRQPYPLLPLSLLRTPTIWRSDALAACHGAALVSLITYIPIYLHVVRGVSATETGYILLPIAIGIGIGSLVTGRLVSMTGRTAIFPSLGLVPANLLLLLIVFRLDQMSLAEFAAVTGVAAMFMGSVMGVVQVTVQNAAARNMLGAAAGSVQFSRAVGAAFGTALVGAFLFAALGRLAPDAVSDFAALMRAGPDAMGSLPNASRTALHSALDLSFRMVFLSINVFASIAMAFAWSIPTRRL